MRRRAGAVVVALALVAVGGASSADAPTRTITMPGKLFDPARLDVLVGTTVAWKNDDSINHTATAENDAFASGYIPPGGTFSFTFTREGKYEFRCTIHRQMRGEVDVFGLVLSGPEAPVTSGRRIVFAGLAPAGTAAVTLRGPGTEQTVKPRADGSFALRLAVTSPGSYRAVAGGLSSPAVRVQLKPIVRAAPSGHLLRVSASPARPGARVVLQRYDRELFGWRDLTRGALDRRSRATFRIPAGVERVRALVRGTKGWADAATPGISLVGHGPAGSSGGGSAGSSGGGAGGHSRGHIG
jgi:plastocyanin